jgi:hypothetical protein
MGGHPQEVASPELNCKEQCPQIANNTEGMHNIS